MNYLTINFDRPVSDMAFSYAHGSIVPSMTTQKPSQEEGDAVKLLPIQDELATAICHKLNDINGKLDSILPQWQSLAVDYVEGFVGALFESDRSLVRDKILSNLNSAIAKFEAGTLSEIFVHPELVATIEASIKERAIANIRVAADPLLQLADCRIEGPEETLIARLQRQLLIAKQQALGGSDD